MVYQGRTEESFHSLSIPKKIKMHARRTEESFHSLSILKEEIRMHTRGRIEELPFSAYPGGVDKDAHERNVTVS